MGISSSEIRNFTNFACKFIVKKKRGEGCFDVLSEKSFINKGNLL